MESTTRARGLSCSMCHRMSCHRRRQPCQPSPDECRPWSRCRAHRQMPIDAVFKLGTSAAVHQWLAQRWKGCGAVQAEEKPVRCEAGGTCMRVALYSHTPSPFTPMRSALAASCTPAQAQVPSSRLRGQTRWLSFAAQAATALGICSSRDHSWSHFLFLKVACQQVQYLCRRGMSTEMQQRAAYVVTRTDTLGTYLLNAFLA